MQVKATPGKSGNGCIHTFMMCFLVFLMILPVLTMEAMASDESFILGKSTGEVEIWMVGNRPRNVYFQEFLPALFERTLTFTECDLAGGSLEWIFTGEKGGFTIGLDDSTLHISQRYYDSFGLHPVSEFFDKEQPVDLTGWFDDSASINLYPEKKWFYSSADLGSHVRRVTVILDHKLGLTVQINGEQIIKQICLMDVQRHQLKASSTDVAVRGSLVRPDPVPAVVKVDPSVIHQDMIGFGGTCIPTAYAQLTPSGKKQWWDLICEYNLLIQRENPIGEFLNPEMTNWENLDDATPHYYGDNFPNGNISNFSYNRKIQHLGGQVWFEFWSFPKWAYEEREWIDNKGRNRSSMVNIDSYLRAMIGYCNAAAEKAGAPPDIVGIQNERTQLPETYYAMTTGLRRALDSAGYSSVKIHMSNANMMTSDSAWGKRYANAVTRAKVFTQSPETWKCIDYTATNMYDFQEFFNKPDDFDRYLHEFRELTKERPFLSTEMCVNNSRFQRASYRIALLMGQLYHKNLTIADASAILYCWTLVNVEQPSFGWSRSLFVPDRSNGFMPVASSNQLRVYGSYSRRIKKGMVRIAAESDCPDLLVTAFAGDENEKTVVILNRSTVPHVVTIEDFEGFTCREISDPYHQNELTTVSSDQANQSGQVSISPGAILTLTNVPLGKVPEDFAIE